MNDWTEKSHHHHHEKEDLSKKTLICEDDNIDKIREHFPDGLSFVVGDTHGQRETLIALMNKIKFDPSRDKVYFVGDYNSGGDVGSLLDYIAQYYQENYESPGFHLIRGNHEHELEPIYPLENLPDVLVIRGRAMNYYIAHAGMIRKAFEVINKDMDSNPEKRIYAYKLATQTVVYDAPLRLLIWSRRGLYTQNSRWKNWPAEDSLKNRNACIIHGHSPYCYFKHETYYSYGSDNLFWTNQHIWFSEALQSFNIDSNIKGRYENNEGYRGLSCICLNLLDEIVASNNGNMTVEALKQSDNFVFGKSLVNNSWTGV